MNDAIQVLIDHVRAAVTVEDIREYAVTGLDDDANQADWMFIRESGRLPEFVDWEVIDLNIHGMASEVSGAEAMPDSSARRFRRLSTAVGMQLVLDGVDSEMMAPLNYIVLNLIADAGGEEHQRCLFEALAASRQCLRARQDEEDWPFVTLGMLIMAQSLRNWDAAEALATQLVTEERDMRKGGGFAKPHPRFRSVFLLGLTAYDTYHEGWLRMMKGLVNPTNHAGISRILRTLEGL